MKRARNGWLLPGMAGGALMLSSCGVMEWIKQQPVFHHGSKPTHAPQPPTPPPAPLKPPPPEPPAPEPPKPEPKPIGEYPAAQPVPGREGFVFSPYNHKVIDVKGLASGSLAADPTYPPEEKKWFRVP